MTDNPMHPIFHSPRCTAHSKRTGLPCKSPAVNGWKVCRMHGARGGAPIWLGNGNFRHGVHSQAFTSEIANTKDVIATATAMLVALGGS